MSRETPSELSKEELIALIAALRAENAALKARMAELQRRLATKQERNKKVVLRRKYINGDSACCRQLLAQPRHTPRSWLW
jgi:hypothetical protein